MAIVPTALQVWCVELAAGFMPEAAMSGVVVGREFALSVIAGRVMRKSGTVCGGL
jgi:hypothetical protein